MLRFILKNKSKTCDSSEVEKLITLDCEVPLLEKALLQGGYDQYAYDQTSLVGVEILLINDKPITFVPGTGGNQ